MKERLKITIYYLIVFAAGLIIPYKIGYYFMLDKIDYVAPIPFIWFMGCMMTTGGLIVGGGIFYCIYKWMDWVLNGDKKNKI